MILSRRNAMTTFLALPLILRTAPARATPETMQAALDAFTGGAPITPGRVTLKIPLLVENGNSVPLHVSVDSLMVAEDHVTEIAIFNELNPLPDTAHFYLGHRSGLAAVETRIRLNGSQTVHAVARMNDGSFWSAATDVIVTAPACREV
jgi:sulfur-oxidizing protein SoxY